LLPADVVNRYGPPHVEDCDYARWGEGLYQKTLAAWETSGVPHMEKKAERLRKLIPFLKEHGLYDPLEG
jgi:hypothetical protein